MANNNGIINFTMQDYTSVCQQHPNAEEISSGHYVQYVTIEGVVCNVIIANSLLPWNPQYALQLTNDHFENGEFANKYVLTLGDQVISSFWLESPPLPH